MTELKKYKIATNKLWFLVQLWLREDCGCKCSECEELLAGIEEILEKTKKDSGIVSE